MPGGAVNALVRPCSMKFLSLIVDLFSQLFGISRMSVYMYLDCLAVSILMNESFSKLDYCLVS